VDSIQTNVGVLDKSVAILAALAERGPLSLAGLVEATGLPRPTAHRLAAALEAHRLVGRDGSGRYRLGLRLLGWAGAASAEVGMVEAARPVLVRLRDETGESTQLFVRDGGVRVCVASAERPHGLRDTVPVGAVLPLERGSGGTVLRAWDGAADPDLVAVRRRGWAESVAEREEGVASVSAPVLDARGRIHGAVSVSGPIGRLGRQPGKRLAPAVVAAAREVELAAGLAGS
jgi:DNA-binding IclR family transcriptional regulator